jgi:hypothetical protein
VWEANSHTTNAKMGLQPIPKSSFPSQNFDGFES